MTKEMGTRISDILKRKNMSQKSLAELVGVNEVTISRYISGEREPKPETLANIATALRTTSDFLLGIDSDDPFSAYETVKLVARNASKLTAEEKKQIINALIGNE